MKSVRISVLCLFFTICAQANTNLPEPLREQAAIIERAIEELFDRLDIRNWFKDPVTACVPYKMKLTTENSQSVLFRMGEGPWQMNRPRFYVYENEWIEPVDLKRIEITVDTRKLGASTLRMGDDEAPITCHEVDNLQAFVAGQGR